MANEIEKLNTVAITSIETVNGRTDTNIEKINNREFTGETFTAASGGNSTATDGDYKVHTFTSSGNLNVSAIGSTDIEYLVVAGGGGGGGTRAGNYSSGGGGGAGGMLTSSSYTLLGTGNHGVTVGSGGNGSAGSYPGATGTTSSNGGDSVWNSGNTGSAGTVTATGGGRQQGQTGDTLGITLILEVQVVAVLVLVHTKRML